MHTVRKLDTLNLDATLGFLKGLNLKWTDLWMNLIPLKITSWTMGEETKLIKNLEVNLVSPSHHPRHNKFGWEMIGLNVKLCSMLLKLNLLVSGTLIVGTLDTWKETNPPLLL